MSKIQVVQIGPKTVGPLYLTTTFIIKKQIYVPTYHPAIIDWLFDSKVRYPTVIPHCLVIIEKCFEKSGSRTQVNGMIIE